jgi:hypothetical protein
LCSIKNKEFQSSRIGSFSGECKTICCHQVMVRTFQLVSFPMSDVLGNSQYVTFESAMSEHVLLLRSIGNPTKCNWECARLHNQLWSPKMICIAACTGWKCNNVQQREIKRCWYSLYSWSCFLFC